MSRVLEKIKVNQICRHCREKISISWVCRVEADGIVRYIYFCPNCQKTLHISNKKNFKSTSSNSKAFQV